MKHVLSVDVQKKDAVYQFTLHYMKKTSTLKVNSLKEGFDVVEEIAKKGWVESEVD